MYSWCLDTLQLHVTAVHCSRPMLNPDTQAEKQCFRLHLFVRAHLRQLHTSYAFSSLKHGEKFRVIRSLGHDPALFCPHHMLSGFTSTISNSII